MWNTPGPSDPSAPADDADKVAGKPLHFPTDRDRVHACNRPDSPHLTGMIDSDDPIDGARALARDRQRWRRALVSAALAAGAILWMHLVGHGLGADFPRLGIVPRDAAGLVGVLTAPLVHGSWAHVASNAIALLVLLLRALAGRFRRHLGNDDILFWMISNRILPPVVAVLPIYMMFQKVGLLDTHLALILTYAAVNLPIVVWLMRDFFATIPYEIEESAQIDGAGRFRIVATIILPLARAGLAATFLLVLILAWNEYLLALFLSTADAQTMPLLVAGQNATRGPQWWYMSVLIVLMVAPVVALAIALQRYIAKGFLVGAVKG
jgi:ABC-type glycerol-3-phosphate transport system permease component